MTDKMPKETAVDRNGDAGAEPSKAAVGRNGDVDVADTGNLVRRWAVYIAGIYILTLGLSLAIRANIGISPQSSLTRTMTLVIPGVSQGTFNLILELIMFGLAILVLPKAFKLRNFLSLVPALILATLLDFNLWITEWIVVNHYVSKVGVLVLGDAMLAFGLFLMINANLVLMPIDMFVDRVQKRTGRKWGNVKTIFDCTLLLVSTCIGLAFLGAPQFIREGTIINAILVGQYIKLYFYLYRRLAPRRTVAVSSAEPVRD